MPKQKKNKIELLAPVGDFPSLVAAVEAGADAIYFGLKDFNMRDSAKNFTISDLNKINKKYPKIKKYLTLNTIIYNSELKKIESTIKKIKGKVDAVICWDPSIIMLCKKYKIPFHVSTQASISNIESAKFYKKLGAQRIVLARELNLKQIKEISKIIDTEVFAHGAMCVSISGRCFTSQFMRNRSANRGQCTHPCRRAYIIKDDEGNELKLENNKVMSAKDLCTLPFIEKIKKANIKSIKIEGRNRSADYVYSVIKTYRKALDNNLSNTEIKESLNELKKVYNRGFSSGFYLGLPTADDFTKTEHGETLEKKMFMGKIKKYWKKANAAALYLNNNQLKIGDEIYITGNKTGIKRHKITSMEIKNKPIKIAKKGDLIGLGVPECRENDEVYLIVKK